MNKVRSIIKAKEIIDSLGSRKGFEFDGIEEDIMDEIIEEVAEIIQDDC